MSEAGIDLIADVYEAFNDGFVDGFVDVKRQWFHDPDFDVYLRTGPREFYGRRYYALTIADVTVKESARGQGILSMMLLELECAARLLSCEALFVENLRPELMNPLAKRRFWARMNDGGYFDMLKELG
jgi:GNAT superfamily N-acetyltransferase